MLNYRIPKQPEENFVAMDKELMDNLYQELEDEQEKNNPGVSKKSRLDKSKIGKSKLISKRKL